MIRRDDLDHDFGDAVQAWLDRPHTGPVEPAARHAGIRQPGRRSRRGPQRAGLPPLAKAAVAVALAVAAWVVLWWYGRLIGAAL